MSWPAKMENVSCAFIMNHNAAAVAIVVVVANIRRHATNHNPLCMYYKYNVGC